LTLTFSPAAMRATLKKLSWVRRRTSLAAAQARGLCTVIDDVTSARHFSLLRLRRTSRCWSSLATELFGSPFPGPSWFAQFLTAVNFY